MVVNGAHNEQSTQRPGDPNPCLVPHGHTLPLEPLFLSVASAGVTCGAQNVAMSTDSGLAAELGTVALLGMHTSTRVAEVSRTGTKRQPPCM